MDKTFSDYRQAVRRFRQRKKRKAEVRLVLVCVVAYSIAFFMTASRGSVSQAPAGEAPISLESLTTQPPAAIQPSAPVAPSAAPALPEPETVPRQVAEEAWDRDIHALPSRGQFKRFYRVTATAYRPINTRMEGGRWTVTERDGRSAHGVAVDPDIIPLGSRLWIPGYGHAVADDIGGWIKGHRIDIRCQDDESMDDWGRRNVRVYVLEDPSETQE
jgi:3D (Asp-Asp-Asp) domain-containing protein